MRAGRGNMTYVALDTRFDHSAFKELPLYPQTFPVETEQGHREVRQSCWLRHCATSRKVSGSINKVIGFFQLT
jgi:hypothetical protein